jgi:hypothetical protein
LHVKVAGVLRFRAPLHQAGPLLGRGP